MEHFLTTTFKCRGFRNPGVLLRTRSRLIQAPAYATIIFYTSVTFHDKIFTRVCTARLPHYATYRHMRVERPGPNT